jgi:hypothetical protein
MNSLKDLLPIAYGLKSYLPFGKKEYGTGGTDSARYCYSVWLRHLSILRRNGMASVPTVVAELGPGDSLGIGLAALLSGTEHYYALDVVEYIDKERNLSIFEELIALFRQYSAIPDDQEFPSVQPKLVSYELTQELFSRNSLEISLISDRIDYIRQWISDRNTGEMKNMPTLKYVCPWYSKENIRSQILDLIFSQAVLEHVDELKAAYQAMKEWLKPGGYISHQIDFGSHRMTDGWNGHRQYSDFCWRLIRGNRPYLINREPLSKHLNILEDSGFKLLEVIPIQGTNGINRRQAAKRFRNLTDADFYTRCAHIVAQKI